MSWKGQCIVFSNCTAAIHLTTLVELDTACYHVVRIPSGSRLGTVPALEEPSKYWGQDNLVDLNATSKESKFVRNSQKIPEADTVVQSLWYPQDSVGIL